LLKKFLFDPLGITGFKWSKMRDGYSDGSGLLSIQLHSEDLVKIGKLILSHGWYAHKPIVPEKWIKLIMQPDKFYPSDWGFDHSTYALCYYHANYNGTDITYGMGWGGQFLIIIPSLKAVVVINENTADATAINQSVTFINHIFPVIFDQLKRAG
jgi:CubicO group peptidase (beta-lactamase class C family)